MRIFFVIMLAVLAACSSKKESPESNNAAPAVTSQVEPQYFELRTYYAAEGKLDDLQTRFRDHTTAIFERLGMVNMGYWIPIENENNTLVYLLGYENKEARDTTWKAFFEDEAWKRAYEASIVNGRLVDSVKSLFLTYTDYSPKMKKENAGPRVFETRTYYTNEGKLPNLHTRFRDHTMGIFEANGMTNVAYFNLDTDQENADNTLFYIISHTDTAASKNNWSSFLEDPNWQSVYQASIEDGKIVAKIDRDFLLATDFSDLK